MAAGRHTRVVMLVGGDDEVARACARAVAPLPIVRAKHVDTAAARLRELRPVAVYLASDLPAGEAHTIDGVAAEHQTPCIHLEVDAPEVVFHHLRR